MSPITSPTMHMVFPLQPPQGCVTLCRAASACLTMSLRQLQLQAEARFPLLASGFGAEKASLSASPETLKAVHCHGAPKRRVAEEEGVAAEALQSSGAPLGDAGVHGRDPAVELVGVSGGRRWRLDVESSHTDASSSQCSRPVTHSSPNLDNRCFVSKNV